MKVFRRSRAEARRHEPFLPQGRLTRGLAVLLIGLLFLEVAETLLAPNLLPPRADVILYNGLIIGAGVLAAARCVARREERAAWILVTASIAVTIAAELYAAIRYAGGEVPYPSLADVFYLASYPLMWVAIVMLLRRRLASLTAGLWLDGLIAGLATAAMAATLLAPAIAQTTSGSATEISVNLAYPLADLVLVSLTVAGLAMSGWRPDRTLIMLAVANVVTCVADGVFLMQAAGAGYTAGTVLDALWPLGTLLLAFAAWQPAGVRRAPVIGARQIVLPVAFTSAAIALLVVDVVEPVAPLSAVLAIGAVLLMMLRFAVTQWESLLLLDRAHRDSLTDHLTGLGNRRALWQHLHETSDRRRAVAMFDLDGFKTFNDRFGHAAGDGLLARASARLVGAAPDARVFRLGGDEFCVVGDLDPRQGVAPLVAALSDVQDGHVIGASVGVAWMPTETTDPDTALRLADERMYRQKMDRRGAARGGAGRQPGVASVAGRATART